MYDRNLFKFTSWIEENANGFWDDFANNYVDQQLTPVIYHDAYIKGNLSESYKGIKKFLKTSKDDEELKARNDYVFERITNQPRDMYPDAWQAYPIKMFGNIQTDVNMDLFPTCKKALDYFGPSCISLVYSILKAGSVIPTHIDMENINEDQLTIHLPLQLEEDKAYMICGDRKLALKKHQLCFLNTNLMHSAHNESTTIDRVNVLFIFKQQEVLG